MRLTLTILITALALPAAALQQPNGTVIPSALLCNGGQPGGLDAIFACVCTTAGICNIGASCPGGSTSCDPGTNGTCETTIWHNVNDNSCMPSNLSGLDPVAEAATTPMTFRPTCPLTFTVLSRGTAMFHDVFGWYNVTGSAPAPSDLHVMLDCSTTPGTKVVLDLSSEPAYLGGEVGFFLLTPESHTSHTTCAGGDCCATVARLATGEGYVYYSEPQFNPDAAGSDSYIHLIIYNSHITQRKFYFAWEDMYGVTSDDFTDLVTSVEGVECSGAGVDCDTGLPGACAYGVTTCTNGTVTCRQILSSTAEKCDGIDNNCDGQIDEGAACPNGEVCTGGRCAPRCTSGGEFDCAIGYECDTVSGLCVESTCVNVPCTPPKVCRGGACVGGCDGVVCPYGEKCQLGVCVAPCRGITCDPGDVCREGLCIPGCGQCGGILCGAGLTCDHTTADCTDPSCASPCAAHTHCAAGACVDDCEGAICPGGQTCVLGDCVLPGGPDGGVAADGGVVADGGVADGGATDGAAADDGPRAGSDAGTGGHLKPPSSGCGCRATGAVPGGAAVVLLGLTLLIGAGRRRGRGVA